MEVVVARSISRGSHGDQRDRFGEPVILHVERVAARVAEPDRVVAYLHDVLEKTDTDLDELIATGLTPREVAALDLLTRAPGESFEAHTLRIAHAGGVVGRLARRVKLADLEDHLSHLVRPDGAPPYAWARLHLMAVQARRGEAPAPAAA